MKRNKYPKNRHYPLIWLGGMILAAFTVYFSLLGAQGESGKIEIPPAVAVQTTAAETVTAPPMTSQKQPKKSLMPKKHIVIDISDKKLYLYQDNQEIKSYEISSSAFGLGSKAGSNKTPLGKHAIAKKIGDGVPSGGIFKARAYNGKLANIDGDNGGEDLVTTRILWLDGLETSNANSFDRYIYIHGTPEENKIGKENASHGCIRMRNQEVIDLYNVVDAGTAVEIRE